MEFLTKDTHLDFSEDGSTYKELYGLNSDPDMGGEPEKVDVSNMRDSMQRNINGLIKTDALAFEFFYNKEEAAAAAAENPNAANVEYNAFAKLKALEKAGKPVFWRHTYPDGSFYSWNGTPTVYMKGGKVGEARQFTLSVSLETTLEYSDGTETQVAAQSDDTSDTNAQTIDTTEEGT